MASDAVAKQEALNAQCCISAGTYRNSDPLLFDSKNTVPTGMNGPTGMYSSQ